MNDEADKRLGRARTFLDLNRLQEAEQEVRAALAEDPDSSDGHALLAFCLLKRSLASRQYPEMTEKQYYLRRDARHEAELSIQLDPNNISAYIILCETLLFMGAVKTAMKPVQDALRLAPWYPLSYYCAGRLWLAKGKLSKAMEFALQGLQLDPNDHACLDLHIRLLIAMDDLQEAKRAILTALQKYPEDSLFHERLAELHLKHGAVLTAKPHVVEALRLNPMSSSAQQKLGRIQGVEKGERTGAGGLGCAIPAFIMSLMMLMSGLAGVTHVYHGPASTASSTSASQPAPVVANPAKETQATRSPGSNTSRSPSSQPAIP